MADKRGAGPTNKKVEVKKPGPVNGPTSKQAFRKVEEEQRARLAKQRKAEEEWLQKLIEKEEGRRKRIQKIITKEEQKTAQRVSADNKGADDARRNLIKNLEAEQRQMRAEQMKRVKAIHRTQMLDRIVEETECATSRKQVTFPENLAAAKTQIVFNSRAEDILTFGEGPQLKKIKNQAKRVKEHRLPADTGLKSV